MMLSKTLQTAVESLRPRTPPLRREPRPADRRGEAGRATKRVAIGLFLALMALAPGLCRSSSHEGTPAEAEEPREVRVLVAYYSLTGNTKEMAAAVAAGARGVAGTTVVVKKVDEITKGDLEAADAIAWARRPTTATSPVR